MEPHLIGHNDPVHLALAEIIIPLTYGLFKISGFEKIIGCFRSIFNEREKTTLIKTVSIWRSVVPLIGYIYSDFHRDIASRIKFQESEFCSIELSITLATYPIYIYVYVYRRA